MGYLRLIKAVDVDEALAAYNKMGGAENLTRLKLADLQSLAAQAGTMILSSIVINRLLNWLFSLGSQKAAQSIIGNYLKKAGIPKERNGKILTTEERLELLANRDQNLFRFGLCRDIVTRVSSPSEQTHKITLRDLTAAIGIVPLAVGGIMILVKPALARFIGTQTFSHGSSSAGIKTILSDKSRGLDPNFGGVRTGATRVIAKSPTKPYHLASKVLTPKGAILGQYGMLLDYKKTLKNIDNVIENPVLIPTDEFLLNALKRTYVAKDSLGRVAASSYAMTHLTPDQAKKLVETATGDIGKAQKAIISDGETLKGLGYFARSMVTSPFSAIQGYRQFYSTNPEKAHVVAGVMPFEDFHKKFEVDPDDIIYGGAGYRTRLMTAMKRDPRLQGESLRKLLEQGEKGHDKIDAIIKEITEHVKVEAIDKKHLRAGSNTFKQIWQNRSKDIAGYLKDSRGRMRVLGGLGMVGAGAGLGYVGYKAAKPIIEKLRGTHKIVRDDE